MEKVTAAEIAKESIIENIKNDFEIIQKFLRIPEITDEMMVSLFNVSKSTIITDYINDYIKDTTFIDKISIIKMLSNINIAITFTLKLNMSDKDLCDSINNKHIKLLYEITKIIVKHIKEFIIILNKKEYPDIQADIITISQKLATGVKPFQDSITKISRDMKGPWSILHFDILLLYYYNLGEHKKKIDDINSRSFFDYDDFVEFTKIFDTIKDQFKFIYYKHWELSELSFFKSEYELVLIHKISNFEVSKIDEMDRFLLSNEFVDIEHDDLYFNKLNNYIKYMTDLNNIKNSNHEAIIKKIKQDKLDDLDELKKLEETIKEYLLNLNTITKLTERRNKLFSRFSDRKEPINITEEVDQLKKLLETMSTGVSLIRYNIMDEEKKTKPLLIRGGFNTRKKIKQSYNFIKDFTNYIP